MYALSEVIKTYVLNPITLHEDTLHFQIEILRNQNEQFHARLFRREFYRLKPAFEPNTEIQADECIYILDTHTLPEDLENRFFDDEKSCLQSVLSSLEQIFETQKT
ncbi:hypothetical protein [Neisseria sp.]|uniref:hypothetical protein n=1 Tax=Neisseria sp. TaxID=192066 RepID=UPI0035A193DA